MNSRLANYVLALAVAAVCYGAASSVAKQPAGAKKLARPPKWTADDLNVFFPDARQQLVGARPDYQKTQRVAADAGTQEKALAAHASGWSKLIDAEAIETEIKRTGPELAKLTATLRALCTR